MSNHVAHEQQAQALGRELVAFVAPLLMELDKQLDKRLERTFATSLQAIIRLRHSVYGLLLSELGGYILTPDKAPAGTKRLSNLLRSTKWGHEAIEAYLWAKAERRIEALEAQGKTVLVGWDESVWEKPGSPAAEDLGLVRSAQADRLVRSRVGNFKTTGGRAIVVPGMQWLTLLVLGFKGTPLVAGMQWWTTQGKYATRRRSEMSDWLWRCAQAWGQRVLHIWDRGFAGHRWLQHALELDVRFLVRWRSGYHLVDAKARRPAWHISRGKRSLDHRLIWDSRRRCWRKTGILPVSACLTTRYLVVGPLSSRQRTQALVLADQCPHYLSGRCLATGLRLCPPLAGGDDLSLC